MPQPSSLTHAQRLAAVGWFEQGQGYGAVATLLGTTQEPVKLLYQRWRLRGRGALVARTYKPVFSFEFKLAVTERFLAGEPATALAAEFELSSPRTVRTWAPTSSGTTPIGSRPS